MGDFSGDTLREVSLPLVEKPVYNTPVTLSSSRHRTDFHMIKVPSCRSTRSPATESSGWLLSCSDTFHPVCVSEAGLHQRGASLRPDQTKEELQTGQTVSSTETSRPTRRSLHCQPGRHQTVRLSQLWRGRQPAVTFGQQVIMCSLHCDDMVWRC